MSIQINIETLVELMTGENEYWRGQASQALDNSIIYLVDPCERIKYRHIFKKIYEGLSKKSKTIKEQATKELVFGWLDFMKPYMN